VFAGTENRDVSGCARDYICAGQETGKHKQPCPVVGFSAEAAAALEGEGEESQTLPAGSSSYEGAERVIVRFDSASSSAAMKFIAPLSLERKQELIEMLPGNKS